MYLKLCLLFLTLFTSVPSFAQVKNGINTAELSENLKLPTTKAARKKTLSGKYTFTVELNGTLSNIAIKDTMGFGIDEQIIKQLNEAKNWKVAEINGQPTRIAYSLPITIKLPKK